MITLSRTFTLPEEREIDSPVLRLVATEQFWIVTSPLAAMEMPVEAVLLVTPFATQLVTMTLNPAVISSPCRALPDNRDAS